MTHPVKFSVLDLAHVYQGESVKKTLEDITASAQHADSLNYHRYWFAEHHNTENLISTSPELLSSIIAGKTNNIHVGAGGVMLPNHSSLAVMERFSLLESLYPGRIDLGLGRAPGTDPTTSVALARSPYVQRENDFPEQLDDLLHYFNRDFPLDHPYSGIKNTGNTDTIPEIFMLGSSQGGVQFAVEKGLGFAFASHINPSVAVPVLNYYKENFKKVHPEKEPYSILSIAMIIADTDEEAAYLAKPLELMWAKRMTGDPEFILLDPAVAADYQYTPQEAAMVNRNAPRIIAGSMETVAAHISKMVEKTNVDEIMLVDYYPNRDAKNKALTLLAEHYQLTDNK